jgi:hypothetical protein
MGTSRNMQRAATGRAIQRFTSANMAPWSGTQADAVNVAKAYDVIAAHPGQFGSYLPAMRAANPNLTILVYMNGTFVHSSQMSSYPSSWFLHNSSGQPLHSGYNNYVMDPTNSGWVADRVKTCQQSIGSSYDGCMIDMLGSAPTQPGYLNGTAINPATNQPYTAADWLAATTKIGAAVAQGVAPKIVIGNGLGSGVRYFDPAAPSEQLFGGIYGAIGEAWLKNPGSSATSFPTEAAWQQNVDALVDAGNRGRTVMAMTKTWGGGTATDLDAWHRFALASFLLGTNGGSYFEFSSANNQAGIVNDSPYEHVNIGMPTGAYTKNGNVYQRSFTTGMALVNPTTTTNSVSLSQTYCDLNGSKVNSVTLGPDGADVLYAC